MNAFGGEAVDNTRLFIWMTLLVMIWLTYRQWLTDYPAEAPLAQSTTAEDPATSLPTVPESGQDALPVVEPVASQDLPPVPAAEAEAAPTQTVHVRTDVLDLLIDLNGGDLVRADVPEYPVDKTNPDVPVRLLDYEPDTRWVYQSGYRSAQGGDEPNHLAMFTSAATDYELADGQDELVVSLQWAGNDSLRASKVYRFHRGSYAISLTLGLENDSAAAWSGAPYIQLVRRHVPAKRSYTSVESYSYSFRGPVLYDGDRYEKLDVDDLA